MSISRFRLPRLALIPPVLTLLVVIGLPSVNIAEVPTGVLLPDGREFVSWEVPLHFSKTYYVDNRNPKAADSNPGTAELPFLTINHAAQVVEPGERVVITSGVYRERVSPARGGTAADKMISYEAAPGATVIVKGSRLIKEGWEISAGYTLGHIAAGQPQPRIHMLNIANLDFHGYNPFAMVNLMGDRRYLNPTREEWRPHLLRRGMIFVDGRMLEQVELYREMAGKDGTFWCEQNGLTVHVRLPGDADPARHEVELVIQEQVFAPEKWGLNYIRVKGITFEQAANGFPVPQRGLVSATGGNHWIIDDCVIRHATSAGLDIGGQDWNRVMPAVIGHSIVRRCHIEDAGVCGIAGMGVQETLIESNLIENVGWQKVELMWECGGIKLHETRSCLVRDNVIRHLRYAPGIWLDYENKNTRVTGNLIGDLKETVRGGIYLEASQYPNMLDSNIFWDITIGRGGGAYKMPPEGGWGIILDGSDDTVIAHNLFGRCQDAGVKTRTVEDRIVGARGGTARDNHVTNNVFYRCGKGIDFSHEHNTADGDLYSRATLAGEEEDEYSAEGRGLNWISGPGPALRLDLPAWQKYFGFDKNGACADIKVDIDLDGLKLTWAVSGPVPEVAAQRPFERDFRGEPVGARRAPGPFGNIPGASTVVNIDPRR